MNVIQGALLGLIQGLGEFLPISSSGHLLLAQKLFGLTGFWLAWPVAEFLTLIVSVIFLILFRKRYHYM